MQVEGKGAVPMFHVYDVPTAVAFYRDGLGFEVVMHSPPFTDAKDDYGWALLRLQGVELMLNNMYEDNVRLERDAARQEAHGDTTLYVGCRDVDGAYAELKAKGIAVNPPKDSYYGMRQMYLWDPDGYCLCFQWPNKA